MGLPIRDPNTVHKLGEDVITAMCIMFVYIHWDQEIYILHEIREMLCAINTELTLTYNTFFYTKFTNFRAALPWRVNTLRAQIHRNAKIINIVHRKLDFSDKHHAAKYLYVNIALCKILQKVKRFIAVFLTKARAK